MDDFTRLDTKLTLRSAHESQLREALSEQQQTQPPAEARAIYVLFNLEAAFDLGHAILGLGTPDGPIETYSFYRHGNKMKAPALMATLEHPVTFDHIRQASGWIVHGTPPAEAAGREPAGDAGYWNEHVNSAFALWCTPAQFEKVSAFAQAKRANPGTYDLLTYNCLHFVVEALSRGGITLTGHDGRPLRSILPKNAFKDVAGATGAQRLGAWKYWFPNTPAPEDGLRTISDELDATPQLVKRVDHLVITVTDLDASLAFYQSAVGLRLLDRSEDGTLATMRAGDQLVRLQTPVRHSTLMAKNPVPGSVDACFATEADPQELVDRLRGCEAPIVAGPVEKHGSHGAMTSVYTRDPDGSLIELCTYR